MIAKQKTKHLLKTSAIFKDLPLFNTLRKADGRTIPNQTHLQSIEYNLTPPKQSTTSLPIAVQNTARKLVEQKLALGARASSKWPARVWQAELRELYTRSH